MPLFTVNTDNLLGDASDETFVATASTLGSPDSADGGGGTDVVSLQGGGRFDFTGVTLSNIDGIETDGSTTTMVFADAATALLVTDASGTNDRAQLDYDGVLSLELVSLLSAGVESVIWTAVGDQVDAVATLNSAGQMVRVLDDTANDVLALTQEVKTFDIDPLTQELTVRSAVATMDNGDTRRTIYDEDGDRTSFTIERADGSEFRREFDGDGTLTTAIQTDGAEGTGADLYSWSILTTTYAPATGDVETEFFQYDADNPLDTKLVTYNDDGSRTEVLVASDGDRTTTTFRTDGSISLSKNGRLVGTDNDDRLRGFDRDDILEGGLGDDWLLGGGGSDIFVFEGGFDVIVDFENGTDLMDVSAAGISFSDLAISNQGNGTRVIVDGGEGFFLRGITTAQIDQADFIGLVDEPLLLV